jgi:hypothetical protein
VLILYLLNVRHHAGDPDGSPERCAPSIPSEVSVQEQRGLPDLLEDDRDSDQKEDDQQNWRSGEEEGVLMSFPVPRTRTSSIPDAGKLQYTMAS